MIQVLEAKQETKYYHAENSNRPIESNGFIFTFDTYDCFAGTPRGFFSSDDPLHIEALELLASDPATAVRRVTKQEYDSKYRPTSTFAPKVTAVGIPRAGSGTVEVDFTGHKTYPSITQQTDWPCGFFFFPQTQQPSSNFNPSIVRHNGDTLLFVRRFKYNHHPPAGQSDLVVYKLGKNNHPILPAVPAIPYSRPMEQWEDPRAVVHNGEIFVSMVQWVHYQKFPFHQVMVRYDPAALSVVAHPVYRGNGGNIFANKRSEKNWIWFVHDDAWHLIYSASPHIVARFNDKWELAQEHGSAWKPKWDYGEIRGGTPPVRAGHEYVTFFHSSGPGPFKKRRYYMGAYAFEAKPPFKPTRITKEPLLVGSEYDQRIYGSPCCVFPGGSILKKGEWFVVFGVNDEQAGHISIPHVDLERRMNA